MRDNLIQFVYLEKSQVCLTICSNYFNYHLLICFSDKIVHYSDSHHIAVYHKGRWFKVLMFYRHSLLQPCELQMYVLFFDIYL